MKSSITYFVLSKLSFFFIFTVFFLIIEGILCVVYKIKIEIYKYKINQKLNKNLTLKYVYESTYLDSIGMLCKAFQYGTLPRYCRDIEYCFHKSPYLRVMFYKFLISAVHINSK